jgi:hypothetical protein
MESRDFSATEGRLCAIWWNEVVGWLMLGVVAPASSLYWDTKNSRVLRPQVINKAQRTGYLSEYGLGAYRCRPRATAHSQSPAPAGRPAAAGRRTPRHSPDPPRPSRKRAQGRRPRLPQKRSSCGSCCPLGHRIRRPVNASGLLSVPLAIRLLSRTVRAAQPIVAQTDSPFTANCVNICWDDPNQLDRGFEDIRCRSA